MWKELMRPRQVGGMAIGGDKAEFPDDTKALLRNLHFLEQVVIRSLKSGIQWLSGHLNMVLWQGEDRQRPCWQVCQVETSVAAAYVGKGEWGHTFKQSLIHPELQYNVPLEGWFPWDFLCFFPWTTITWKNTEAYMSSIVKQTDFQNQRLEIQQKIVYWLINYLFIQHSFCPLTSIKDLSLKYVHINKCICTHSNYICKYIYMCMCLYVFICMHT